MKKMMTAILIATIAALVRALFFVPRTRSRERHRTMPTAGRLIIPPSVPGGLRKAGGRYNPMERRSAPRYPDQPIATAETARPYSRMRSQPMIHAQISPSVM